MKHIIVFLLLFFAYQGISQEDNFYIQKIEKGKFLFQNNPYTFQELGDIIKPQEEAYSYYTKSLKAKKQSRVPGWISIGMIGGGISMMLADGCLRSEFECSGGYYVGAYTLALATFPAVVSLANLSISSSYKSRAIKTYNNSLARDTSQDIIYKEKESNLSIDLGATGLSMRLSF